MRPALITTALAATLAAGCSATTSTAPTDTAQPAAAKPSSSTAPMTRQTAAKYYLATVKPWNDVWPKCTAAGEWSEYTDAQEAKAMAACRKMPGLLAKEISAWEHPPAPWPTEARGPMQDLIDSSRALSYCVKKLRDVRRVGDYFDAAQSCPDQGGDHTADIVRAHLGLPAAPR